MYTTEISSKSALIIVLLPPQDLAPAIRSWRSISIASCHCDFRLLQDVFGALRIPIPIPICVSQLVKRIHIDVRAPILMPTP
jgi:hypothetical protein